MMGKFRVIYCIVVSVTNAHSVAVAPGFGFSPTVLSVGVGLHRFNAQRKQRGAPFHARQVPSSRTTRLYMGEEVESSSDKDVEPNSKRKPNQRARMKKINNSSSSSRSKLLTPPSIQSSTSRQDSPADGRRWANSSSVLRKRISPQNNGSDRNNKPTKKKDTRPTELETSSQQKGPPREDANGKKGRNTKSGNGKKIPPFTSASDVGEGSPSSPPKKKKKKKVSDPAETLLNQLQQPQNKQPSFESSLFGTSKLLDLPSSADFGLGDISSSAIDGVLPVSELFYRSTQSIPSTDIDDSDDESQLEESDQGEKEQENAGQREGMDMSDDEELPFSKEQSDSLSSPGNKIHIRKKKNKVEKSSLLLGDIVTGMSIEASEVVQRELTTMAQQEQDEQRILNISNAQKKVDSANDKMKDTSKSSTSSDDASRGTTKPRNKKSKSKPRLDRRNGRKMVRRGMEMLVGGEPINADPPQRHVELNYYQKHPQDWARAVTTNSRDFGPLLHMHSAGKVGKESVGLFCENFVAVARKWDICPDDLLSIAVSKYESRDTSSDSASLAPSVDECDLEHLLQTIPPFEPSDNANCTTDVGPPSSSGVAGQAENSPKGFGKQKQNQNNSRGGRSGITSDKVFEPIHMVNGLKDSPEIPSDRSLTFTLGGELKFSLGINRSELEYGNGNSFRNVLRGGIGMSINADKIGFDVHITKLVIIDVGGGSTDVDVQFQMHPQESMSVAQAERAAKEVNGALASAMDDGKLAMTLAHMAQEEKGWSESLRSRIVEEFLFETEDDEENNLDRDDAEAGGDGLDMDTGNDNGYDGPFGMEGDVIYAKDDIWLGGGNGGVFFDYSESNSLNSPFKGQLGPHLVDAAVERAKQNQPRVIAIGDVHGCIDELKALLKKCDYHPGDIVVFLGDLVCKGPDSLAVVQMAREIGAIGIRGNHDFEVVRWHQAIKSGADPPLIGSEHYYIASALSTADIKWMYSLPWFISSTQLNALFVHAGFVSGIRLAKQNPRLMMNMRSILPDGTVTSKFFNNWPWARLWDGPQTVLFGHDADRGLQQYEHAIGLDTGCVYGGKLTACILPERRIVSVNARREYFQYRRKHFD